MSRSGDTRGAEFSPVYLGYVQYIIAGAHADVGKLQPVVEVPMDERTPPRVLDGDEVIERFLYSGRVSWYHFPEGVELNTWWSFRIEEAETFDATNQRHDQMRVRGEALPALEVIDARGLGDDDAVRDILTGRGITLSYEPTEKVYLWTASNQWIGPLRLRPHGTTSHQWIADHHTVQSPIPVAQAAPALYIATCSHEGATRRFHIPQGRAGQSEGRVDWSSDEVMLKRVLRSIRSADQEFTDTLRLTHAAIDRGVEKLQAHAFATEEPEMLARRLQRASKLVRQFEERLSVSEDIEREVLKLPHFQREIDARVQAEVRELVQIALRAQSDVLDEMASKVQAKQREYDELWGQVAELEAMRRAESEELDAKREEIARQSEALHANQQAMMAQFEARVQDLVRRPGELLADLAILRVLNPGTLGHAPDGSAAGGASPGQASIGVPVPEASPRAVLAASVVSEEPADATLSASVTPESDSAEGSQLESAPGVEQAPICVPSIARDQVSSPPIEDDSQLRRALRAAARGAGIPVRALYGIHAALVGGSLPVVAGDGALSALEAYARAVSGGDILWLPVTPAMIEPADLLGRPSERGYFIPHAAGLLDYLLAAHAAGPDGPLRIVILDGINRAPVDAYLAPVLDAITSSAQGDTPRELPVCHPAALNADDPYHGVARLSWPSNVLVVATMSQGPATLPPSAAFWHRATLVSLPYYVALSTANGLTNRTERTALPAPTRVNPAAWHEWGALLHEVPSEPYRKFVEDLVGSALVLPEDLPGERFVLQLRGHDESDWPGLLDVLMGRIAPRAQATGTLNSLRDRCPIPDANPEIYTTGLDFVARALS